MAPFISLVRDGMSLHGAGGGELWRRAAQDTLRTMPTERLYFADPAMAAFSARVLDQEVWQSHPAVILDRTAFYPEGGGQPADRGRLDATRVLDVQVDDAGVIRHLLEAPLPPGTTMVTGTIDWPRRLDHMQQHLGQHLLSAVFATSHGLPTVGFHLGADHVTIDLPSPPLGDHVLADVEQAVNDLIQRALPADARFVTTRELATLPLRKQPSVDGPIRVVSVPGVDHSPCGGTHPATTAGVGSLLILGEERRGPEIRISFLCGDRVRRYAHAQGDLVRRLARSLTVGAGDLPEALDRLQSGEREQRRRAEQAETELAEATAAMWVMEAVRADAVPVVGRVLTGRSSVWVRQAALAVAAHGAVAVLAVNAPKPQIVLASPPGRVDAVTLLRDVLSAHGGKGGGTGDLAQGGVPPGTDLEALVDSVVARVSS